MDTPTHAAERPALFAREINLTRGPQSLWVQPKADPARPPIPLTRVTDQQVDWLRRLAVDFYESHRHCLTMVMLLWPDRPGLTLDLPPQTCSPDGAAWRYVEAEVVPEPPLLIGTFSSVPKDNPDGFLDDVPQLDGVHLLIDPRPERLAMTAFFRIDGVPFPAAFHHIVQSTTQSYLDSHATRWELAQTDEPA